MLLRLRELAAEDPSDSAWRFLSYCGRNMHRSKSQLFQDLFVLFVLGERSSGYFVEFGATDGRSLSNTYLLESEFGWTGVLAEPGRCWHERLLETRRCAIDRRCVWSRTGEQLEFHEAAIPELSTLADARTAPAPHGHPAEAIGRYSVETVSLNALLDAHGAPRSIDYMSIDTEGSEWPILEQLDFSRYDVRVFTIEHNHGENRERVRALLESHGYERVFERFSLWDDWYVRKGAASGAHA